jgi:hypothetical protein
MLKNKYNFSIYNTYKEIIIFLLLYFIKINVIFAINNVNAINKYNSI